MLSDGDIRKKDAAVKCLEVMSTSDPQHWQDILQSGLSNSMTALLPETMLSSSFRKPFTSACTCTRFCCLWDVRYLRCTVPSILPPGGVPALVKLLEVDNEEVQSVAASVLCNISEHDPVRRALTSSGAARILIALLGSHVDEIQSRAAIILSDLACVEENQANIASLNGIPPLVNLLESELEDVLVNAVNAVRVLCSGNAHNQTLVAECNGIESLVEFLGVRCFLRFVRVEIFTGILTLCCGTFPLVTVD